MLSLSCHESIVTANQSLKPLNPPPVEPKIDPSKRTLVSSTVFWFLFERAGYNLLSLVFNVLLLLVAILFLWAKSASLLNRPLPPVPNTEIPEEFAVKAADDVRFWINRVLSILNHSRWVFFAVILWAISYVGTLINSLTLVYIEILLSLSVPIVYEKYQDHIDDKLNTVRWKRRHRFTSLTIYSASVYVWFPEKIPKNANPRRRAMSHGVHSRISLYISTLIAPGG